MISIIICSRAQKISPVLSQNIEETIGCAYEFIFIDNSENTYSIFEAYNLGIKKSKGNFWCFMHDDIFIHTNNWGLELIKIFESDSKIGLIGVAGAKIKTKMPSAWFDCPESQKLIYLQHYDKKLIKLRETGWENEKYGDVAIIDGVFMVGKKDESIKFDERLNGFHNYDLYLSLTYRKENYKVIVTRSVLLEHFSNGKIDKSWYKSTLQFDFFYRKCLPIKVENPLIAKELKILEFINGKQFCVNLLHYNLTSSAIKYWFRLLLLNPFSNFHLRFLLLFLRQLQATIYRYYQIIYIKNPLASKK